MNLDLFGSFGDYYLIVAIIVFAMIVLLIAGWIWNRFIRPGIYWIQLNSRKTILEKIQYAEKKMFTYPRSSMRAFGAILANQNLPSLGRLNWDMSGMFFVFHSNILEKTKEYTKNDRTYLQIVFLQSHLEQRILEKLRVEFETSLQLGYSEVFICMGKYTAFVQTYVHITFIEEIPRIQMKENFELRMRIESMINTYGYSAAQTNDDYYGRYHLEGLRFFDKLCEHNLVRVKGIYLKKYRNLYL